VSALQIGAGLPSLYAERTTYRPAPRNINLEVVFELLSQIFNVVRWPVLNIHAEVQAHA